MFDWHLFHASEHAPSPVVDPRRRLRACLIGFAALVLVVLARAVQLEVTQGAGFRAEANRPLRREHSVPGARGRILARDGAVLAQDKSVQAVAVQYRYLEAPPDARWLRAAARARLPKRDRKNAELLQQEESRVAQERAELSQRLTALCGVPWNEWNARARRVQARVERIAEGVERRRQAEAAAVEPAPTHAPGWLPEAVGRFFADTWQATRDDARPVRVTVAEQLDYHVMAEETPPAVVAEIEGNPQRYPGVRVLPRTRRVYPAGTLAAHVLGHLGPVEKDETQPGGPDAYHPDDLAGRMGLERQYEDLLRGRRGLDVDLADHTGRVLSSSRERAPHVGRDLVLTLDAQLQRTAEELLDQALERNALRSEEAAPAGGAIVVLDVRTGALAALAAAPRFDPNWFVAGSADRRAALLDDAARPLFDRACRMAIAPGSVFKVVSATALLESRAVDPRQPLFCQGYLRQPDSQRCEIYVRRGVGHGDTDLSDALCVSCNVYFFHHAGKMGPDPLVDWARQFGFGHSTGVDLPSEAPGTLPTPETIEELEGHAWRTVDTEMLSIGQGSLTATPLQVARMMAAVANGGRLVTPHLLDGVGLLEQSDAEAGADTRPAAVAVAPPRPIAGLHAKTLEIIREGLERVVADPEGTAHATVYLDSLPIAGKTGTAETGGGQPPHAWFAGYAPAEKPEVALVVALERAGSGATAAGPVAKRLVLRMAQLGMLGQRRPGLHSALPRQ